ncbi:Protein neuralized [Trichinella pseudospiralis]|uniref:Protein neuralized n=1 Tax=Trichinella pseudospiralis TaxID=6337 RepID=A0A0V1G621_TRIPS|nr:Protein neuralized [Trichinella pseudospiralis]
MSCLMTMAVLDDLLLCFAFAAASSNTRRVNEIVDGQQARQEISRRNSSPVQSMDSIIDFEAAQAYEPLAFHLIHGDNIRLSENRRVARREKSFCKALVFSNRPVQTNEYFGFKIVEVDDSWSGTLRIGITNWNPKALQFCLPKFACPDLIELKCSWAKAINERYCKKGHRFLFSVNKQGEMTYTVNGHSRGLFLSGIKSWMEMYVVIDIYGHCKAVQLIGECYFAASFYYNISDSVLLNENRTVVTKHHPQSSKAYAFICQPFTNDIVLSIEILKLSGGEVDGTLSVGFTGQELYNIRQEWLKNNVVQHCTAANNNNKAWILDERIIRNLLPGDRIQFYITENGVFCMMKNDNAPKYMSVIDNPDLYLFFNLCGTVTSIRIEGYKKMASLPELKHLTDVLIRAEEVRRMSPSLRNVQRLQPSQLRVELPPPTDSRVVDMPAIVDAVGNLSVLSSSDECSNTAVNERPQTTTSRGPAFEQLPVKNVVGCLNESQTSSDVMNRKEGGGGGGGEGPSLNNSRSKSELEWDDANECKVCMTAQVDTAVYSCGHYCMCYPCAMETFANHGCCPICRETIKDVMRIFKS